MPRRDPLVRMGRLGGYDDTDRDTLEFVRIDRDLYVVVGGDTATLIWETEGVDVVVEPPRELN